MDGVLGSIDVTDRNRIVRALDRDGYVVFDARLPGDELSAIIAGVDDLPAYAALNVGPRETSVLFDPLDLRASRYDYDEPDLLGVRAIQRLLVDPTLGGIADSYLRRHAVFDNVGMWRSFAFGEFASSAAAQLFHSDRDHLRFVKFFVYLTDVTPRTGPHVFVRGSHRQRPAALRRDVRFEDDEVLAEYPAEDVIELCGPAGTIMAVDTSGLHKGKLPDEGTRLILQFEFATSRYGTGFPSLRVQPGSPEVERCITGNRHRFDRLDVTSTSGA